jgi:hypothetical protein
MYQRSKIVKHYFRTTAAVAVGLMVSSLVPALKANEADKKTTIKLDQAIDVQGTVLAPGSYVLKILGSSPDRYTVEIFHADEKHIITTILATPEYRQTVTANSEFKFYDVVAGQPPALHTWFYPGDNFGFEFSSERGDVSTQSRRRHPSTPTSGAGGE